MASLDGFCDDSELNGEVQLLKEIYINEVEVNTNEIGGVESIGIQLHPATGEDLDSRWVCLTLLMIPPSDYPDSPPVIMIKNPRGLGEEHVIRLQERLEDRAEERRGLPVLYELIELAKESLTEGNLPFGECVICKDTFHEGEPLTKTDCYHHFHCHCLLRHVEYSLRDIEADQRLQREKAPHLEAQPKQVVCPICREDISYDLDLLRDTEPPATDDFVFKASADIRDLQRKMAALFRRQQAKGGIIDVEAERNKFLVPAGMVLPEADDAFFAHRPPGGALPEPEGMSTRIITMTTTPGHPPQANRVRGGDNRGKPDWKTTGGRRGRNHSNAKYGQSSKSHKNESRFSHVRPESRVESGGAKRDPGQSVGAKRDPGQSGGAKRDPGQSGEPRASPAPNKMTAAPDGNPCGARDPAEGRGEEGKEQAGGRRDGRGPPGRSARGRGSTARGEGGPHPERGGPHPERGGPLLERGGPHPERGGPHPERGGPHPERGGPHPEREGPHPERGEARSGRHDGNLGDPPESMSRRDELQTGSYRSRGGLSSGSYRSRDGPQSASHRSRDGLQAGSDRRGRGGASLCVDNTRTGGRLHGSQSRQQGEGRAGVTSTLRKAAVNGDVSHRPDTNRRAAPPLAASRDSCDRSHRPDR